MLDEVHAQGAKVSVELLGDALNVKRFGKATGDFGDGDGAVGAQVIEFNDQRIQLAQEQVASLPLQIQVFTRLVGAPLDALNPIPQALATVAVTVQKDEQVLVRKFLNVVMERTARFGIWQLADRLGRVNLKHAHAGHLGDGSAMVGAVLDGEDEGADFAWDMLPPHFLNEEGSKIKTV